MDTGSTAFILLSAALVMVMTPGLAFFYAGLMGRKNTLELMMQSFISVAWTSVIWVTFGFSMTFGSDIGGIIGGPDYLFLSNIGPDTPFPGNDAISMLTFMIFQMMVAVITPALISGAFAGRVRFKAYMIFLTFWLVFVYFPVAHMIWGGGILQQMGVLDFGGGIVVHMIAGFSALASVAYIGKRKFPNSAPHSIPLVAIGMAMLWFGWFVFNAGSELKVDSVTALSFVNTQISAAFAAMVWMFLDIWKRGKPSSIGFMTGALAGLVTVTPGSGFVSPQASMLIGIVAGLVSYCAISYKNRKGWDDALDVWGVHGVGGFTGIILLGLFATTAMNPEGTNGLFFGNPHFFAVEVIAVLTMAIYAFIFTYGALWAIDRVTPVRATEKDEKEGLDSMDFGEAAYD